MSETPKKQVRCKICGAIFDEGADVCPVCGVGKEYFEPVEEAEKVDIPLKKKQVRCKICGAIFDEGADVCPVCGVGKEYFEPVEEAENVDIPLKKKQVRCKICGAIFDEGADVCPVCGVGKEYFEPVEEAEKAAEEVSDTAESIIIIGGGIAAVTAAEAARKKNKKAAVTIIAEEKTLPYNRPMLTKDFDGAMTANPFPIAAESHYKEINIDLLQGKKVVKIVKEDNLLYCDDNSPYYFDKLIFATGANCFVPPFEGREKQGVFVIRRLADVRAIAQILPTVKSVAVIGGGVLGIEAAWYFYKMGKKVSVLEAAASLFAGKISAQTSDLLQSAITAKGVAVLTEAQTAEIMGTRAVTGIKLADGRQIEAEMVIISCGIRADIELAVSCGLKCGKAIEVDAGMHTNLQNIYACGDCASFEGVNFGLWSEALLQAQVAGENAADGNKSYQQQNPAIIMKAFDTALLVFGSTEKEDLQAVSRQETINGTLTHKTFYYRDGRLCGVTSLGNISDMSEMMQAVTTK